MFVLITGGGRTGTQLAELLMAQHHQVRVVEHRPSVLTRLHRDLPTEMIYEGLATDPTVLELAGARHADVVATTLTSDEDNLVICYMARELFGVNRTIARVNDPRHVWLFDDKFHVDVSLDNAAVMASMIQEEMSLGDMMTLLKLNRGEYSLVEEKIPPGAPIIGKALQNLGLVDSCVIAAIIRAGKVVVPRGSSVFQVGDEVLAVTDQAGMIQLRQLFSPEEIT
jgi:trk system potassium uptake protein TrkA